MIKSTKKVFEAQLSIITGDIVVFFDDGTYAHKIVVKGNELAIDGEWRVKDGHVEVKSESFEAFSPGFSSAPGRVQKAYENYIAELVVGKKSYRC